MNCTNHTPRVLSTLIMGALMAGCLGDVPPLPTSQERAEAILHCPQSFDEHGWYIPGVESVSWVEGMCQVECDRGYTLCEGVCLHDDEIPHSACDRCQNTCMATWECVHINAQRDSSGRIVVPEHWGCADPRVPRPQY